MKEESLKVELGNRAHLSWRVTIHSSLGRGYHLTSSFRDLRLFSELGPPALFRCPVSFLFHPWIATALVSRLARSLLAMAVTLRPARHVSAIFYADDGSVLRSSCKCLETYPHRCFTIQLRLLGTRNRLLSSVNPNWRPGRH